MSFFTRVLPSPDRPVRPAALLSLALALLSGSAVQLSAAPQRQELPPRDVTAFENVNLIPMDSNRVVPGQTVLVREGRIEAVGPAGSVAIPSGARRVDGTGKYLIPGLAEMHGHVPTSESPTMHHTLFLYVANGITTLRGMQGGAFHTTMRAQIDRGELLGPRFFAAGPQLSASSAPDAAAARAAVQRQKEAGFDLLKIQEGLTNDAYLAIASEAKRLGIEFSGHVPDAVGLWGALAAGQKTIDHLDNYMEAIAAPDFPADVLALAPAAITSVEERRRAAAALATRRAGVAVVPTMPLWEMLYTPPDSADLAGREDLRYMPPFTVSSWFSRIRTGARVPRSEYADWRASRNAILKSLSDAGVTILLGTDSPQLFSVPGFSIHAEMASMSAAGMTPWQILRSGTWNVAEHFGILDEAGSIAAGKRADLILLEANPLQDVRNVGRRAGVMVDGRWLPESEIQVRLQRIEQAYRSGPAALPW